MAVATPQRQNRVAPRNMTKTATRYQSYGITRAAVGASNRATTYPEFYPRTVPSVRPQPHVVPAKPATEKKTSQVQTGINRAKMLKTFGKIVGVMALCFLMIYRYAMILESNDRITKLTTQVAELTANNQAMQDKLDRGLELGSLETYATEELGMIRPDSTQVFYVDVQLENTTVGAEDGSEKNVLQGAPGALVHAIQVLK